MKKLLAIVLTVALLAMGLVAPAAYASVIKTDTFLWTAPNLGGGTGNVTIVETMLDEAQTTAYYAAMAIPVVVTGQEAFIYTVTNVDWTPVNGANGFSGFNITNQFNVDTVGNAFGPPGWEAFAGYSGVNTLPNPDNFEWDIRDDVGSGLTVGQTGVFGFTVEAGRYADVSYGPGSWMHSWSGGLFGQVDITNQDDISGPREAFTITKELVEYFDDDGDGIIEVGEETSFVLLITVTNNADQSITNVWVKDHFGADLEVDSIGVPSQGNAGWTQSKANKSPQYRLWWNVGTLLSGASATLTVTVSTDTNPGNSSSKNPKSGKQEYTEPGIYELNSGANVKGDWLVDWQRSASSDPISVEVFEAN